MSGTILPFHPTEHATADALLPWYVNGTLRGEELELVTRHIAACEQCRKEVVWLRDVFDACVAMSSAPDAPSASASATPVPLRHDRERTLGTRIVHGWQTAQPWMRGLMVAQLAALAVLGGLVAVETRDNSGYRTLGTGNPSAQVPGTIAVMFDPAITESEMRRVVVGVGGRIVDGPTSTHAFVVEVPATQVAEAVQTLRTERMVRFAEPLGARIER